MQALVQYASSDEEDGAQASKSHEDLDGVSSDRQEYASGTSIEPIHALATPVVDAQGPAQGPALQRDSAPNKSISTTAFSDPTPGNVSRRTMQSLTLPPVAHIEIPPSPPASPDPDMTARVQRFLALKEQGIHLNEMLASKPALRNPNILANLMTFAGISEEESWASSLPPRLQVGGRDGFDASQSVERLELERKRQRERNQKEREHIEFSKGAKEHSIGIKRARE